MVDSTTNTPWTRNVAGSRNSEQNIQAPTASVSLGSGSRNKQRKLRFPFLKGKRNIGLPVRKGKEVRLALGCRDWRRFQLLGKEVERLLLTSLGLDIPRRQEDRPP